MLHKIKSAILGLAIADAIGVPVEFTPREELELHPVTTMRGFGTYNQPAGTWSDDTSMTLCLMDSLTQGRVDYNDIMQKFDQWMREGAYTPYHELFDIGNATRQAILRYEQGMQPLECGGKEAWDNGNGSLMRILPLAFYIFSCYDENCSSDKIAKIVQEISALTHAHIRSQMACTIYITIAIFLLRGKSIQEAVSEGMEKSVQYYEKIEARELQKFLRIREVNFAHLSKDEIKSSGYVVDTLEAAIWCLLTTSNYKDCVLKAVNLGEDTDTVAAVAGGLAGIAYGIDDIPIEWMNQLARREWIEELCEKFESSMRVGGKKSQ